MRRFIIKTPEIRSRAAAEVMAIRGEDNLEVVIQEHKDDQTAEQRGFFHVLIKILADELGSSPDATKIDIKRETFGSRKEMVRGVEVEVIESSAKAKRGDYSELIETTYRISAEYGIVLPNARWNGS